MIDPPGAEVLDGKAVPGCERGPLCGASSL